MDFETEINNIADMVTERKTLVKTEEATKMTFIIPFLKALGYDVYNSSIVVPEYTADVGIKKGEKVDYAIFKDETPFILIEAKNHSENLDNHGSQLIRYFNAVPSIRFAILTNGIEYRFFTDIEQPNIMDTLPFLVINLENLRPRDLKDLKRFIYAELDIDDILGIAKEKKYYRSIQEIFKIEVNNPSDEFVVFFAKQLTNRRMTNAIVEEFRAYIKKSFKEIINDLAYEKISSIKNNLQNLNDDEVDSKDESDDEIITTQEELQGLYIVKSILGGIGADLEQIQYKDTKSYFGVNFKGMVTKWICRLMLNDNKKSITFPDGTTQKLNAIEEIYSLKDKIIESYQARQK